MDCFCQRTSREESLTFVERMLTLGTTSLQEKKQNEK